MTLGIISALIGINLVSVLAFRDDKRRAVMGARRISESSLLTLAAIGGSPGALYARRAFRHKTCKQPFTMQLYLIVLAQVGVLIWWTLTRGQA